MLSKEATNFKFKKKYQIPKQVHTQNMWHSNQTAHHKATEAVAVLQSQVFKSDFQKVKFNGLK